MKRSTKFVVKREVEDESDDGPYSRSYRYTKTTDHVNRENAERHLRAIKQTWREEGLQVENATLLRVTTTVVAEWDRRDRKRAKR